MKKIFEIWIVGIMVLASLAFMLGPYSPVQVTDNASAAPYYSGVNRTWDAGSNGDASLPANWDPVGVPATGDNITFDSTAYNCNWNVVVTLGDFSMLTGYTGTVTQTVSFGCVDWLLEQGVYTGNTNYVLTCEGNWTHISGTLTGS